MPNESASWTTWLKAAIGIALLVILFSTLDPAQFVRTLSAVHPGFVAAALLAYIAGKVLTAVRWALLARPLP